MKNRDSLITQGMRKVDVIITTRRYFSTKHSIECLEVATVWIHLS